MESARTGVSVESDGFAIVKRVLDSATIEGLIEAFTAVTERLDSEASVGVYAVRNLLEEVPAVAALGASAVLRSLVTPVLGNAAKLVRALLFDKIPGANWKVPWHQDLTIAVRERREVPGFGPWSVKAGVLHVQPPPEVLERMLAVRLHLDDCPDTNGALRVIPASHKVGRLTSQRIQEISAGSKPVWCSARAGDALLMRPLLLHASSPSHTPHHRRVIHIEYAGVELRGGLEWFANG